MHFLCGINNLNWLVMIVAVSFLFTGEKILKGIWKAAMDTSESRQKMKKVAKGIFSMPGKILKG